MTPGDLARMHAAAFDGQRPWTAAELTDLLASPGVFLCTRTPGFVLGRIAADEAELLTLAVRPDARREGHGQALLRAFETRARDEGAAKVYLDVASDNTAALALYRAAGWQEVGRRKAYYPRPSAPPCDALSLRKQLT